LPELARFPGKKKRPSRENRTPKVPCPGERNKKEEHIFKNTALTMPSINVHIFQLFVNFLILDT
jgi:hypothetical protein